MLSVILLLSSFCFENCKMFYKMHTVSPNLNDFVFVYYSYFKPLRQISTITSLSEQLMATTGFWFVKVMFISFPFMRLVIPSELENILYDLKKKI